MLNSKIYKLGSGEYIMVTKYDVFELVYKTGLLRPKEIVEKLGITDEEFNKYLLDSVLTLEWFKKTDVCQNFSIRFPKAYPILDEGRYKAQEKVNSYFENSGIILCGREAS